MVEHGVHIRGIDTSVLEQLKQYCVRVYGTYHGTQGEIITRALKEFLSSKQHQTTFSTISPCELRSDVKVRVDRIRENVVLYMSDSDNETGRIPLTHLMQVVRTVVGDERTVRKYVQKVLPGLKLIEILNGRLVQVNPGWIPTKPVVEV